MKSQIPYLATTHIMRKSYVAIRLFMSDQVHLVLPFNETYQWHHLGTVALSLSLSLCIHIVKRAVLLPKDKMKCVYRADGVDGRQTGNMLGCCLVSFHFRCDIHPIRPVLQDENNLRFQLTGPLYTITLL